ncbi:papain family cysteine protease [Teladorsagia circumcincta]|uniref:Papain family cysteine protease n=1 Tax=Teladorsagia circumcincta TaxID=45464 RepID=A0A2G9UMG7_TELCI|nr:papain family cysteine protease [Teladorsagia circumcincta]
MWARNDGVCSGGRYQEQGVCKPYTFHPCGYHKNQTYYGECPKHTYQTPACKKYCQYGYGKRYDSDKIYATAVYRVSSDEAAIRAEIFARGPVQASFATYEDFAHYKSGIYIHTAGKRRGGHAVKIIGWGVENGTKYWTVANSWNTDWGEDGGYFRIVRGVDNCGFESGIVAGDFR